MRKMYVQLQFWRIWTMMKTLSAEMDERLKLNPIPLIGSTRVTKFGFSNMTQKAIGGARNDARHSLQDRR
jgi:hypothetical protein